MSYAGFPRICVPVVCWRGTPRKYPQGRRDVKEGKRGVLVSSGPCDRGSPTSFSHTYCVTSDTLLHLSEALFPQNSTCLMELLRELHGFFYVVLRTVLACVVTTFFFYCGIKPARACSPGRPGSQESTTGCQKERNPGYCCTLS